jgi:putative endonuclease
MFSLRKDVGTYGECTALEYLAKLGYVIIEKNFRCSSGEIDIIAKDGDYITFIEVKSRYCKLYGSPSESVTYNKQLKLYKTAQYYIMKRKLHNNFFRFDVVEILFVHENNDVNINLIKNAFQL